MSCQLAISGWYSNNAPRDYETYGDDFIRQSQFRGLWWKSITEYLNPDAIFITDSKSPIKPVDELYSSQTKVITTELLINPGHSQNCLGHFCGYTASVIMGLQYALHSGVDYVLYIEQDVLIFGEKFVDTIEKGLLQTDFLYGRGSNAGIEQSVFAISRKGIRKFIARINSIDLTDKQLSPEFKFILSANPAIGPLARGASWENPRYIRRSFEYLILAAARLFGSHQLLTFGYGRQRPIRFDDDLFYFQHGSKEEIERYKNLTGF